MDSVRRVALPIVVLPLFLFLVSMLFVAPASEATGKRHAKVSPHTGLVDFTNDGQYVTITWSGFPARSSMYIRECQRGATDIGSQCSQGGLFSACGRSCPGTAFLGTSDSHGGGKASARVAIGAINLEPTLDPIPGKTFTCDYRPANRCSLFVLSDVDNLRSGVEVPITFARPQDACPADGTFLPGAGGGPAWRQLLGWASTVCDAPRKLALQYRLLFSGSNGVDQLVDSIKDGFQSPGGDVYYAVTTGPMSDEQAKTVRTWKALTQYAPISGSGLVFAYRMYDPHNGKQIRNLVLTPELLAEIFTKQLSFWNTTEIKKLNPGVDLPNNITAYGRGDASDETWEMTNFFFSDPAARKAWIAGGKVLHDNPFAHPTEILPSLGQISLVTGAKAEANAVALDAADTSSYGLIGYMDSSWAALYNLPTVRLRLANGKTVPATGKTIAKALASMTWDANGGLWKADPATADASHWPIPTVSYAVVPWDAKDAITEPDATVRAGLTSLLTYAAGAGQQSTPEGYVPLPKSMSVQTKAVADGIEKAVPIPVPQDDSTGPTTPPTEPSAPPTGPPTGGGDGLGGGVTPPPPTSTGTPSPSPADGTSGVIVAEPPPSAALIGSSSHLILPTVGAIGIAAAVAGLGVLYGPEMVAPVRRWRRKA